MTITINNVTYDIGEDIVYPQTNPTTNAYSDKVKYRLTQQNAKILIALQAIADLLGKITEEITLLQSEYIWAADDNTIIASDDDTILIFCSDIAGTVADLQTRMDAADANIAQLAGEPVVVYSDPT